MPCLNSVKNSRVNPPMSEPISPTNSTYCRTQTSHLHAQIANMWHVITLSVFLGSKDALSI